MFDCGINEIVSDMVTSMEEENEKMIYKAVQSVGIDIDKEQLEKALFNAKSFYDDGYNDAKKQYEPKWIPVSERTPEKEETYACLVTVEEDDIWGEPQRVVYPEYVGYDGETWVDASGKEIPFEVIAWMPRPNPYKEDE